VTDYTNILKAVGAGNVPTLNAQQQSENYEVFSKMMKEGIYLPDLVKKMDAMETRIKELEKGPKQAQIDIDIFAVMESAVKNDEGVRFARQRVQDEKTRVLSELCMKDESYRKAFEEYRREVNTAYIRNKESIGDGHPQIREESAREADSSKGDKDGKILRAKNRTETAIESN